MAKRLHMTTADYVVIALSPALIMTLVGSLVFFLIEVMYTGEYVARLNYAFALFVFATVLIARISIEMGAERASVFALALGVVMFLALMRFVEFPSAFSHLINLALMGVVWWCAHKLTWDCTLIDDDEDASGEGLMQRIGVDGPDEGEAAEPADIANRNELLDDGASQSSSANRWWRRLISQKKRHTPGLWVLYFSLAALPIFGIGQSWIPVADVGRRRYAFVLLFVYVFSALSLLVTTSFLGLRRYLRQRRLEMPVPVAGTWIATGAVLIAIVLFISMLIPRPAAEVAISRVPWEVSSPGGNSTSKYAVGNDGEKQQDDGTPRNSESDAKNASDAQAPGPNKGANGESQSSEKKDGESGQNSSSGRSEKPGRDSADKADPSKSPSSSDGAKTKSSDDRGAEGEKSNEQKSSKPLGAGSNKDRRQKKDGKAEEQPPGQTRQDRQQQSESKPANPSTGHPSAPASPAMPQAVFKALGGLSGFVKLLLYALIGSFVLFLLWKHRRELMTALIDIARELRAFFARLFGGRAAAATETAEASEIALTRAPRFADFRDPFASGDARRLAPDELVRYTFSAFEAWANDHGCPRTPDRTPSELLRTAVATESPMYDEARRMVRLYSELAYAARTVSREAANNLQGLWKSMSQA